jgi:catalase (peroxidase I)
MNTFIDIVKKTSIMEIAVFGGIACLAIAAGYASLTVSTPSRYGDITGSAHMVKVTPLSTMQPMPDAIDGAQH